LDDRLEEGVADDHHRSIHGGDFRGGGGDCKLGFGWGGLNRTEQNWVTIYLTHQADLPPK
jgi:hypothetical protein